MNKPASYVFVLAACLLFCLSAGQAKANNAAGGELLYEWVGDSTYRFYFKFYRDCAGNPEPTTVTMCVRNTCNANSFTRTLTQITNPVFPWPQPPYACPQFKNQCDSPASTIPGAKTWWYTDTCTLPSRCSNWIFSVSHTGRPGSINLVNPTITEMYVEATMNNTGAYQGNSSPYFTAAPISIACLNSPLSYNDGPLDPDNDSMSVEVIHPLTGGSTCPAVPVNAVFATGSPALSIPNNPFQCGNTFTLNPNTGAYAFTPTAPGTNTLAIRINEYRNGVKIGSVMRERSLNVLPCAPQTTTTVSHTCINGAGIYSFTGTVQGIEACTQSFSFCYTIKATDPAAKLVLSDNHVTGAPGSAVVYTNQYSDSVNATFTWTPTANDTGLKILVINLIDTVCKYPGTFTNQSFTIPIFIWSRTRAAADTLNICAGTAVQLLAVGGGNFQWSVLNGTPGSLSCTSCASPVAMPTANSQYVVNSTINPYCGYTIDTVTVNLLSPVYPYVNTTVSPDTNVWPGLNVTFTAAATSCSNPAYQWQKNSIDISGANAATWSSTTLADMDVISCKLTCNDTCATPKDTVSNAITMHVATGIKSMNAVTPVTIYPNPNTGQFTITGMALADTRKLDVEIWNSLGQLVYKNTIGKAAAETTISVSVPGMTPGRYQLKVKYRGEVNSTAFTVVK